MALKLMYITNRPDIAVIAENAGVDRIFVDMEYIGKAERQKGHDTAQHHHTIKDIKAIRQVLKKAELLVRVNPIHEAAEDYCSSKEEIDAVIEAGADVVMLPYFKTVEEVKKFIEYVDGRAITFPLLETPEAVEVIDDILKIKGIDEIHIGLNDLSLGYHENFLFEPLADGTVDMLVKKFKKAGIPYGFGGIASIGKGMLPAEYVIKEHYRLKSTRVILSRSFCNVNLMDNLENLDEIRHTFDEGVKEIRMLERECAARDTDSDYFKRNREAVLDTITMICINLEDHQGK
ncbi:MAG: aldolase/citrate lyase family protein [Erysipelotrichaceae bacterium]|nr:aldolase/citrate lyase family protein [Erysipelotrichaceae bacterium]